MYLLTPSLVPGLLCSKRISGLLKLTVAPVGVTGNMTGKDVVAQEVAEVQIPAGNPSFWSRSVLQVLHLLL